MLSSTKKKRGRPTSVYRMPDGTPVPGLMRRADGRWKVSATGQTFVERDEHLALVRFNELTGTAPMLGMLAVHPNADSAVKDMTARTIAAGGRLAFDIEQVGTGYALRDVTLAPDQWAWLRVKILTEPKWVAHQLGIEQIGWLSDVKQPVVSPTMRELIETYSAKADLSPNEASRSKHFWAEFTKVTGITQISELTHDHVARYEKSITGGKYAPKSILHRYRKVRTVLAYAIKRGKGIEHCRKALDITAMLEVKNHTPLDPRPLPPKEFWAIHKAAVAADDHTFATLMLMSLNCALYGGEVSAVKWSEVNLKTGTYVGCRPKTGVSRVGVLWPEVIAGLKKVERRGDFIFYSTRRSYNVNAVLKAWREYRDVAKLGADVVFSQIRDASFTCAGSIGLDQAKLLAGHKMSGVTDHYLRRSPELVAGACKAIYAAYFSNTKKKDKK